MTHCTCPKAVTRTGLVRSGTSYRCPEHGDPAPDAARQPPVRVIEATVNDRHGWHCPCAACRIDRGED